MMQFPSLPAAAGTLLLIPWGALASHTAIDDHRGQSHLLGVSGGSIEHVLDRARAYCYTGTLGALVKDVGGAEYMLSNNHVLAKENDPDNSLTPDGNIVIQPGLLDEGTCTLSLGDPSHRVGYLASWVPLEFGKGKTPPENTVDAAIAGNEAMSAEILGIGGLSGNTVAAPTLGLAVQKSGRTTGHTFGQVTAVDVTLTVSYSSGQALFVNQLELTGTCMNFSDAGDSGSMIVTVPASSAEGADAVGLLFAGGGDLTFANPVNTVLDALTVAQPPLTLVASAAGTEPGALADQVPDPALCGGSGGDTGGPPTSPPGKGKKSLDHPALLHASAVAQRHSAALLALPGVHGHGIGLNARGEAVIRVYTDKDARRPANGAGIPTTLDGVAVVTVPTGPIRAY